MPARHHHPSLPAGEHHGLRRGGLLCGSLFILPMAAMVDGIPSDVGTASWGGVLFLALLPTGLATIILTFVIRRAGHLLSLVNYQVPVWAVLIGVTVLGEPLPGHFLAALATILTGLAISQRLHRPRRPENRWGALRPSRNRP